jgi:hypothetical protein
MTSSASPSASATRWRLTGRSSSQDDPLGSGADNTSGSTESRRQPTTAGSSAISTSGTASNRGSVYASGTRSAYGSRDASPDTNGRGPVSSSALRKVSPYPLAPPSMIITPSHTPRRSASVEPEGGDTSAMTSADIQRLYERLNAIERETATDLSFAASALGGLDTSSSTSGEDRRGRTMTRSASAAGIEPNASASSKPNAASETTSRDITGLPAANGGSGKPAGGPVVTGRSASVSPRSARRQFYDDYSSRVAASTLSSGVNGGATGGSASYRPADSASVPGGVDRAERSASVTRVEDQLRPSASSDSKSSSSKLTAAASSFFQTIRDRRKLFGGKKSASVDSGDSVTGTSIARIGVNVLTEPAAPSTYQPPSIPEPTTTSSRSLRTTLKLHRRTGSVDVAGIQAALSGGGAEKDRRERASSTTRDGKWNYVNTCQ